MYAKVFIHNDSIIFEKNIASWTEIRDQNLTKQKYDYSCGSASLSTILTFYYQIKTSEEEILQSILKSKGVGINEKEENQINNELTKRIDISFLDLANYASSIGIKPLGLALDLETLFTLKIPVIVYIQTRNNDHFSVYRGVDQNFVYLADPSLGNIKISKMKFQEMFYQRKNQKYPGKILAFLPLNNKIQPNNNFMQTTTHSTIIQEMIKNKTMQY